MAPVYPYAHHINVKTIYNDEAGDTIADYMPVYIAVCSQNQKYGPTRRRWKPQTSSRNSRGTPLENWNSRESERVQADRNRRLAADPVLPKNAIVTTTELPLTEEAKVDTGPVTVAGTTNLSPLEEQSATDTDLDDHGPGSALIPVQRVASMSSSDRQISAERASAEMEDLDDALMGVQDSDVGNNRSGIGGIERVKSI